MKVLRAGRSQKGWSAEKSCTGEGNGLGGCGAKLLVEEADLFTTTSSARDEVTYYVSFCCMACGVITDLHDREQAKLPSEVVLALPTRRVWEQQRASVT